MSIKRTIRVAVAEQVSDLVTLSTSHFNTSTLQHFYTHEIDMSVLIHPNEDEYSAQLIASTRKHYPFQCAEVADMRASTCNKPAVVR